MSNSPSKGQKDLETFFPEPKKIKVGGKEFEIRPVVLSQRIKIVKILAEVLTGVLSDPNISKNEMALGSALLLKAGDRMTEVYKVLLNEEDEWLLENLTMRDEILIVKTFVEVNDIPFLLSQVQATAGKDLPKKKA